MRNNYIKTKIPKRKDSVDDPVEVAVEFNYIKIIEVNDIKLTVTLVVMPYIRWIDQRIVLLNNSTQETNVPIDLDWLNHLWFPDIYVYQLKEFHKYKALEKDADSAGM